MGEVYNLIVDMLNGSIPGRPDVQRNRADLEGLDAVISLYQGSGGEDREIVIDALGEVIEKAHKHPEISAQVLSLVNSFDLAQLEPSIMRLSATPIAHKNDGLREQLGNYYAFRQARTVAHGGVQLDFTNLSGAAFDEDDLQTRRKPIGHYAGRAGNGGYKPVQAPNGVSSNGGLKAGTVVNDGTKRRRLRLPILLIMGAFGSAAYFLKKRNEDSAFVGDDSVEDEFQYEANETDVSDLDSRDYDTAKDQGNASIA